MRFRSTSCAGLALLLAVSPAFALHHHHVTAVSGHKHGHHGKVVKAHWVPGQRGIDAERTSAIQTALISRNYLTGQPSGEWDDDTQAAMQKFQGDNGWQTKLMPDSRALIKLGLGPDGDDGTAIASSATGAKTLQPATGADSLASIHSIQN